MRVWFGNYASGYSKEECPVKSKADTRGHPTSSRSWTAKSVCRHHYAERVSDEQKRLSEGSKKDIGKYHAASATVFNALTMTKRKKCEEDAIEWNSQLLPDDVQQK